MLLVGWWSGQVPGTSPIRGTRTHPGTAGVPGNPGFMSFLQIDLKSGDEVLRTTIDGAVVRLGNNRVFNLHKPSRMRISEQETQPLQYIGRNNVIGNKLPFNM